MVCGETGVCEIEGVAGGDTAGIETVLGLTVSEVTGGAGAACEVVVPGRGAVEVAPALVGRTFPTEPSAPTECAPLIGLVGPTEAEVFVECCAPVGNGKLLFWDEVVDGGLAALVGGVLLLASDNAAAPVGESLAVLVGGVAPPAHAVRPKAAAALSNTRGASGR